MSLSLLIMPQIIDITCFFRLSVLLRGQRIGKDGEILSFWTSVVSRDTFRCFASLEVGSLFPGVSLPVIKAPRKKELVDLLSLGAWGLLVQVKRDKNEDKNGFSASPKQSVLKKLYKQVFPTTFI